MAGSVQCIFSGGLSWSAVADTRSPQNNTIYLWRGETVKLLTLYDRCYKVLNDSEKGRAMSYTQPAYRQRYIIQHGLLRRLLGWYLNKCFYNDVFHYGEYGKPYLAGADAHRCFFSLSSSSGVFLIAISDKEMGIDIEQLKPGLDYQSIAAQYFSEAEQAYLSSSPKAAQAFCLLWTRKEALIKAMGKRMDDNLAEIPALNGVHSLPTNDGAVNYITQSYMTAIYNEAVSISYPQPEINIVTREIGAAWVNSLFN